MISEKTLDLAWINTVSQKNKNADKGLVEKVIRALLLLEGLAGSGLNFVFKGGTALMLLQGFPRRLSIDIDIVIPENAELEPLFTEFIQKKEFTRFQLDERKTNSPIEKTHYKFFYQPVHKSGQKEDYILLDILFEKANYQEVKLFDINLGFVKQDGKPIKVAIPCFEDILGDKLTAFAPNTTGIPYKKSGYSASMEIIKQLYDIGNLFDSVEDMAIVKQTFKAFALTELSYRNFKPDWNSVLKDIFETALCISTRGKEGKGDFNELQDGINRIKAFIFSEKYQIERAIIHASKAAYLSKIIELKKDKLERYEQASQIKDWTIKQPFCTRLNKLKKTNPQAFFYWYQTCEIVMNTLR